MKLALVGYGRMGREVARAAEKRHHKVVAVFDVDRPFTTSSELNHAEVIIDFSSASTVLKTLQIAAARQVPVVEGTTGWYEERERLEQISDLRVVYSPNFSMGMYQFLKVTAAAARMMGRLKEYDCYVHEFHHSGKADSPSGTAKRLAELMLEEIPWKTSPLYETARAEIKPEELHVTSTRTGHIPGIHEVGFESEFDSIRLRHTAYGREAFAYGAVRAGEWIQGKHGIFTMDDFMSDPDHKV